MTLKSQEALEKAEREAKRLFQLSQEVKEYTFYISNYDATRLQLESISELIPLFEKLVCSLKEIALFVQTHKKKGHTPII